MTSTLASVWFRPEWPAPARVHALSTLRAGTKMDMNPGPYSDFNLGTHVGDDAARVASNRALLRAGAALPAEPLWLIQVHGTRVIDADNCPITATAANIEADAAVARKPGVVLAIQTADCLPVLLCDRAGTVVAAAHAGWRGLSSGVIENAVRAMDMPATEVIAWLGPAIGPRAFEVGQDVVEAFTRDDPGATAAFVAKSGGKYLADLYALARRRLARLGVNAVSGGDACTYAEAGRFFSYRRDGRTGRMASLVWLDHGQPGLAR
jgi:YfiH family protein